MGKAKAFLTVVSPLAKLSILSGVKFHVCPAYDITHTHELNTILNVFLKQTVIYTLLFKLHIWFLKFKTLPSKIKTYKNSTQKGSWSYIFIKTYSFNTKYFFFKHNSKELNINNEILKHGSTCIWPIWKESYYICHIKPPYVQIWVFVVRHLFSWCDLPLLSWFWNFKLYK